MQCRSCGYSLWNIQARQCPECAAPFRPSDFEFALNSVRFACPHCSQSYYGTGEKGHLQPVSFACVKCGAHVHMDDMVLQPSLGVTDLQTSLDRMPWFENDRGLLHRWLASIKWAMVQPNRMIRAVPEHSSVGAAWLYAALTMLAFLSIGLLLPQLLLASLPMVGRGMALGFWGQTGAVIASSVILSALLLMLWPITAHALLRISGGPVKSLARTSQAIYYSAGASAPGAIPCCGVWAGMAWWIVSATNMVKEAHRIHGGRAAFAVISLPLLCMIALPFVWYAWLMFAMFGGMMGGLGGGAAWSPQNMPVMNLVTALTQYGFQPGGGPEHAIELTLGGRLSNWGMAGRNSPFCYSGTKTTDADIPINDGTYESYQALPRSQQLGEVQRVLESLPANLVAHRVGDFVLTHHGAMLNSMDPSLWLVVMLPDPDVNGLPQPDTIVLIGMGNYTVTSTTYAQLPALLQQQNAYRASLSLPPLPDPATITHTSPAVVQPSGAAGPSESTEP